MALYCYQFGVAHYIIYLLSWAFLFGTHITAAATYPGYGYRIMASALISLTLFAGIIYSIAGCFYVYRLNSYDNDMIKPYTFIVVLALVSLISNVIYLSTDGFSAANTSLVLGLYSGCTAVCGGLYIWIWCIQCYPPPDLESAPPELK